MTTGLDAVQEADGQTFRRMDCQNAELRGKEFRDCRFEGCDFNQARLLDCVFSNCAFDDCDLSLVGVENSAFLQTRFQDCKIIGVNWTAANWESYLSGVHFVRCAVSYSIFVGLDLKGMTLRRCVAHDADFAEADLTGADCTGTDFLDSRFWQTDLSGADFTGASRYAIAANLNTLKQTRFSLPEALALLHSLDIVLVDPGDETTS